MSITKQLDKFMEIHKYKKTDISKLAKIPYSTIDGLYKKGDENIKLTTLLKLRKLLNCTLDELVGLQPPNNSLTLNEYNLIKKYQQLDSNNQDAILISIDVLITSQNQEKKKLS